MWGNSGMSLHVSSARGELQNALKLSRVPTPLARSITVCPPIEKPAAPILALSILDPNSGSTSIASRTRLRSVARTDHSAKPRVVYGSRALLPGWFTAATTYPCAARLAPSHAIPSAVPPAPCESRMMANLAGVAAIAVFGAAFSAAKSGASGGPSHWGCSTEPAAAGYQMVVTSAWVRAPRQSYERSGGRLSSSQKVAFGTGLGVARTSRTRLLAAVLRGLASA